MTMAIELKVPTVGESITEVMIGEWLKSEGDWVAEDEPVVVIETDKVNVELPAPEAGILKQVLKQEGEDAEVGDVVGLMEAAEKPAGEAAPEAAADASDDATRVMPAARRALAEKGLEASEVQATGPGGRLLKEDVLRHEAKPAAPAQAAPAAKAAAPAAPAVGSRHEEAVRMTPLRRKVAERLVQAQQSAALLTTFNEIDMSQVIGLRKEYQERFVKKYGIKVGFMSFFVKAVVEALKEVPGVNAEIQGDEIVYRNYQDIGIAVGGGKGLVVPIIRNAERLSFAEVEKTIADFAVRARDGKIKLDELSGGTFTISNGGIYGSLLSTPIVNPPQSGILGMHKIEERPIALNGEVVIRPMMYVALTYDHRLVDGREAVTFLVRVKERIEDPTRILLEV
ncbi:MAG: 2-oxoglutarate dehydrogenase complex dihydrolipoyllysine-residue succinyltransferase [Acidobacteriota bacterium]